MTIANDDQAERWNKGAQVDHWVGQQARYDNMLGPYNEMIFEGAALTAGERVLDVGCGCGTTTLTAARAVGPGEAVGVDLSEPMLAQARANAAQAGITNTRFEQADAQVHPFDKAEFDAVISRMGVMFFADPVAAFANLWRATRGSGRIAFTCFQPPTANPWFLVPQAAFAEHVPLPDPEPPDAPGMFALADPDRIRRILDGAGWHDITIDSRQTPVLVGGGGTLDDIVDFLRTGTMGRMMLAGADAGTQRRALDAVRDALAPHADADGVRLDASVWRVTARA